MALPPDITITVETAADADGIDAVHRSAFPTPGEARLVRMLRAAGRLEVSIVARERGQVIGHVAFSPVTPESGPCGTGLAPLAVVPERQRHGVGAALVEAGLAACRALAIPYAVVLGDPRYYSRFGFTSASAQGLHDEYGGGDAFQVLALRPRCFEGVAGLVRYDAAFASLANSP